MTPGIRLLRSRRFRVGTLAVAAAAAPILAMTAAAPAQAATTLRALAEAHGKYFGTEMTGSMPSNQTISNLAGTQFDMVTPGNEMKWDTTEPSNGSYNFGPGDGIVNWAKPFNMRVRGHNLVWHSQLPSWVTSLPLNQVQGAMEAHITTEATHNKGEVYSWDVVNEPFNEDGTLRQDVFYNAMGSGYIADAIRTAHNADPNAKLYLNDYNIEGENAKSNGMYSLAQSLLAQGVPLNGIGFESHFIVGQVPSDMQANMQRFANLGLDVAVTELDDRVQLPATSAELQQQATDYSNVVKDCLNVSRCVGVSQWGVGDADSWIPGTFPGYGAATMYDNNYQPKPAYYAVVTALGSVSGNTVTGSSPGNQSGAVGTPISALQIHATDSASGQTLTFSANGLPPGLSISSSGVISGTPSSGGTFTVTVNATDSTGATGSVTFTWSISGGSSNTGPLHAVGAGKCLDDPNSSTTGGTQQQIWDCNGQANQTWTHTSTGALTLSVGGQTFCLDANGQGTTNGTKAIIWSCNGQANQQWNFNSNGTITGVQSGLCLDVTGASTANGALVELWSCNGGSNQQWKLG
jgi:endo-1,4-beta-xylanase